MPNPCTSELNIVHFLYNLSLAHVGSARSDFSQEQGPETGKYDLDVGPWHNLLIGIFLDVRPLSDIIIINDDEAALSNKREVVLKVLSYARL